MIAQPPDAYTIFARARSYWSAQAYPAQLSYLVTVSGTDRDGAHSNTYESFANTQTGAISVHATSKEEAQHPYTPHGITAKLKISIGYSGKAMLGAAPSVEPRDQIGISKTIRLTKMQQYDLLGVPVLSPTYGFGLTIETLPSPDAPPAFNGGLKTIAAVTSNTRDYDVRYAGSETIDGEPCYHLQLTPLRDPSKYRLRELWVAQSSYAPAQARIQGNFTAGPSPQLPWLVHFNTDGGVTYIAYEAAQLPVRYLGHIYTAVTIAFSDIEPIAKPDPLAALSMFRSSGDVLREP